jgi:RNA polymerase sigma factor (TIGR02999 family)
MVLQTDKEAQRFDELYQVVYNELRKIAATFMRHERPGLTLQPTGLVNEVYIRLHDRGIKWESQAHFVRISALALRRLLIDQSRRRKARGNVVPLDSARLIEIAKKDEFPLDEAIALAKLVDTLAERSPRAASILELHVLAGLTLREIGEQLGISERTAKRGWAYALCWLKMRLEDKPS